MFLFALIGLVIWLLTVAPLYRGLRSLVRLNTGIKRLMFSVVCGTILAPGLLGLGHPPPLPFPGAALLFFLYMRMSGDDGDFFSTVNFASWAIVTTFIWMMEWADASPVSSERTTAEVDDTIDKESGTDQ